MFESRIRGSLIRSRPTESGFLPVRVQVRLGREPVYSRLRGIFPGIGDVSSIIPVARFDPLSVYGDYTGPGSATASSVRYYLEMRRCDLIFTAHLCQPVLPRCACVLLLLLCGRHDDWIRDISLAGR